MTLTRRTATKLLLAAPLLGAAGQARAAAMPAVEVLANWYGLMLELVRHTATYTPPCASRTFAYVGITAFEAVAGGNPALRSLAGQLKDFSPPPPRETSTAHDEAIVLHAALLPVMKELFSNTGPTGQRALKAMERNMRAKVTAGVAPETVERSHAQGEAIARHVLAWAANDGGATIINMGFPLEYDLKKGPAEWVPTSPIALQQRPLLPEWGRNRTFAVADGGACGLPPPPAYSEDKESEFYRQALEVCEIRNAITPEQRAIARFWADDPMLSTTPPGHWITIALGIFARDKVPLDTQVEVLAKLGMAVADGFIVCWRDKFTYNLLRPVTYIRRVIDPKWEPLLITPPFPEYPSGHSTQSGAAAEVLTALLGEDFAFEDATPERDGLPPRQFASFWAAAGEAAESRIYGGIHFRAACELGLGQGRCVGAAVNALKTRV